MTFLFGVSDNDIELLLVIQSKGILRFLDSLTPLLVVQLLSLHVIGGLVTGVVTSLLMLLVWSLFFITALSSLPSSGCWEKLLGDGSTGQGSFGGRILKYPVQKCDDKQACARSCEHCVPRPLY